MSTIKVIEQPECRNDFLRYLVGMPETRYANIPIKDEDGSIRYAQANWKTPIFTLLGFGSTLKRANDMAEARAKELGIKI